MKKVIIAIALAATAAPALAQIQYFLVRQWIERGNQFCQYQNGTVLNIGVGVCPLSIRG